MRVSVVIPARNEAGAIGRVIADLVALRSCTVHMIVARVQPMVR